MRAAPAVFFIGFIVLFGFGRTHYETPVLMYHRIAAPDGSSLTVSPQTFERQMEFLKVHRYRVVSVENMFDTLRAGRSIREKTVAVTFDDGYLDNFQNAFPVLKKMGFPATIFMITNNIGKEGWLSEEDIKILDESGITVGSHTVNHAFLPDLKSEDAEYELKESKRMLERMLRHPVFTLSFPAGGFTEEVKAMAREAGYKGAVTTNWGRKAHDPYSLRRVKITEGHGSLTNFWLKVSGFYNLTRKKAGGE